MQTLSCPSQSNSQHIVNMTCVVSESCIYHLWTAVMHTCIVMVRHSLHIHSTVQTPIYLILVGHVAVEDSSGYGLQALQAVGTVPICTVLLMLLLHLLLHHCSKCMCVCNHPTLCTSSLSPTITLLCKWVLHVLTDVQVYNQSIIRCKLVHGIDSVLLYLSLLAHIQMGLHQCGPFCSLDDTVYNEMWQSFLPYIRRYVQNSQNHHH